VTSPVWQEGRLPVESTAPFSKRQLNRNPAVEGRDGAAEVLLSSELVSQIFFMYRFRCFPFDFSIFTERRVLQFIVIKESARFHSNSTCLLHRLRTVV